MAMEARETKARKEPSNLSYLAAILRNHLTFWKKHSTRLRSLYRGHSTGQGSEMLLWGGITQLAPCSEMYSRINRAP